MESKKDKKKISHEKPLTMIIRIEPIWDISPNCGSDRDPDHVITITQKK